jgi:hypothetical protein
MEKRYKILKRMLVMALSVLCMSGCGALREEPVKAPESERTEEKEEAKGPEAEVAEDRKEQEEKEKDPESAADNRREEEVLFTEEAEEEMIPYIKTAAGTYSLNECQSIPTIQEAGVFWCTLFNYYTVTGQKRSRENYDFAKDNVLFPKELVDTIAYPLFPDYRGEVPTDSDIYIGETEDSYVIHALQGTAFDFEIEKEKENPEKGEIAFRVKVTDWMEMSAYYRITIMPNQYVAENGIDAPAYTICRVEDLGE